MEYIALGCMTGTSLDGIDCSLIKSDGMTKVSEISNDFTPYSKKLQNELSEIIKSCYLDNLKIFKLLNNEYQNAINNFISKNNKNIDVSAEVSDQGTLGFAITPMDEQLEFATQKYGLLESIPAGVNKAYSSFDNYIKQMKLMFKPETEAYKSLGGFLTIGKAFSPTWDWERFWNFTAFLSIILAIMNILPIPALDGGHVMFLLYEMIVGKPAPEKFMEYAQIVGIVILLALMLLANGNDILRLFQ